MSPKHQKSKKDEIILQVLFVALFVYNLFYFVGKMFQEYAPDFFINFYNTYNGNKFVFGVFEFLAVATVLVDGILTHDKIKQPKRALFLLSIFFFVMAFIFKNFVGYMEAVFNFPS